MRLPLLLACLALPAAAAFQRPAPAPAFAKDGVAFLSAHCVRCHDDKKKNAGVQLHDLTDASLASRRKLIDRVAAVVRNGEMPPQDSKQPLASERETFLAAVKAALDAADRDAKPDPGRVTVRRLNRVEYDHTVRDLVGIDFDPAADFPSDDVGHGFDNVADVLTLSPVLKIGRAHV